MSSEDTVPDEIILHIFSFLRLQDRKNCRLVSKRWMNICQSLSLVSKDTVVVENLNDIAKYVPNNLPVIVNLKIFVKDQITEAESANYLEAFLANGRYIKYVHLVFQHINPAIVKEILRLCPYTTHLVIGQLEDPDIQSTIVRHADIITVHTSALPPVCKFCQDFVSLATTHLQSLELVHVECPHIFKIISVDSPDLKSLTLLRNEELEFEDELIGEFTSFIKRSGSLINEVSIYITDTSILKVLESAKHLGGNIESLKIHNHIGDLNLIAATCPKVRNLTKFDMSNDKYQELLSRYPESNGLDSFLISNVMLTEVSLTYLNVADSTIAGLTCLKNLTRLELGNCPYIGDQGLKALFGSKAWPKMQCLYLWKLVINDDCLLTVAPNLQNLKYLRLEECKNLTDLSMEVIYKYTKRLRYLSLKNSVGLSNLTIGDSIGALTELVHFKIGSNGCIDNDKEIDHFPYISYILSKIKSAYFESLFLYSKNKINPDDLKELKAHFKLRHNLQYIGVNMTEVLYVRGFNSFHIMGDIVTREEIKNMIFYCGGWGKIPSPVKCWREEKEDFDPFSDESIMGVRFV